MEIFVLLKFLKSFKYILNYFEYLEYLKNLIIKLNKKVLYQLPTLKLMFYVGKRTNSNAKSHSAVSLDCASHWKQCKFVPDFKSLIILQN